MCHIMYFTVIERPIVHKIIAHSVHTQSMGLILNTLTMVSFYIPLKKIVIILLCCPLEHDVYTLQFLLYYTVHCIYQVLHSQKRSVHTHE